MKIAGIGFRDEASLVAVLDALARAGAVGVRHLALPERKRGHPLCDQLRAHGFTLDFIADVALAATQTPTQSPVARRHYGTGSVAEAAALAALPGARLAAPRALSADRMATAALALTGDPV
ncbi:MAG: cobalamin biosynthesis protein [Rubellimicrobium sp.]|nr:cobalamin biosynthesis protein [Rubellimicrobium sp.]